MNRRPEFSGHCPIELLEAKVAQSLVEDSFWKRLADAEASFDVTLTDDKPFNVVYKSSALH